MSKRMAVSVVSGALAAAALGAAQPPPATQASETPRFVSGAELVALDLVVRDKKGRLVTDLREEEIDILEDGVPQKLTSFRAVQAAAPGAGVPGSDAAVAAAPALRPADPATLPPRRVVLVFGRLSSDGRRLAQSAGDEFARKHMTQAAVTVVRIDGGLIPVLDRSSDPLAVKEAVREATAAIGGGPGRSGGPVGADTTYAGQQLSRFQGGAGAGDLAQADSIALVSALVTVVDGLKAEPGRKTVLLFSEGFAVPPGYEHVFADLQSRANRANVSFYGIDVRGLQLSTQLGSSGAALATAAAISAQQRQADGGPVAREQLTQDDTLQTSLRSDVVDALGHLSTSTGGFLVTQTNDFGRPLARIGEDIRGYYEASYVPSSPAAPGAFRKIEVRVARKDVHVQSRSGYYTTPPTAAGAFAAFAEAQLPSDFEVRSRFYRFGREGGGPFDCLIKVEASLARAEFRPAPEKGRLSGRMALVGRVLNGTGDVVDTFGQEVALGGTPEQIEASRAQTLPLARRLKLPPGNYSVELLVRDAVGNRSSGQRFALTVPAPEGALAMSSLVVVGAVEAADPKSDPSDPLRLGDQRIVPNLGRPVAAAPGATLPVYYSVYVKPGAKEPVTATVEVSRDGRVVARGASPLPSPDAAGRITGLSPIPLQKLQPGTYDVKVTVAKEGLTAEETTTITVGS
jgi:VWFA-related protein